MAVHRGVHQGMLPWYPKLYKEGMTFSNTVDNVCFLNKENSLRIVVFLMF